MFPENSKDTRQLTQSPRTCTRDSDQHALHSTVLVVQLLNVATSGYSPEVL